MTPTTAPVPARYDHWPVALRSAWRLNGALLPSGPGVRGIGWPDTPRVRLSALAAWLTENRAASHLTAAWVWGAVRQPGTPLQLTTLRGLRGPIDPPPDVRIAEMRCGEDEIERLGDFLVTTPLRTVNDLLYGREFGRREIAACRLLLRLVDGGAPRLREHFEARRRPHRRMARERLERLSIGIEP